MTKFATPYNGKNIRPKVSFNLPSLTDQSAVYEADIGFIIEHFVKTGQKPEEKRPMFIDCTSVTDYETSLQTVSELKTQFELLSAKERSEFKNISNWLEFINNPANIATCLERGYLSDTDVVRQEVSTPQQLKSVEKTEATPPASEQSVQIG